MGPKALIQIFTGQRSAQIGEQATGETVFPFGQADGGGGAGDGEFGVVEFKVIKSQYFGGCRPLQSMPAKHRVDPSHQLVGTKRFAHVIIGPGVQCLDDIAFGIPTGEHDRGGWCVHVFTGPAQQREAADIGQLPIEDQQVESLPPKLP